MNQHRHERIATICRQFTLIKDEIRDLVEEKQESFENMPKELQESEQGQHSELAVEELEIALQAIEETLTALEDAAE